MTALMACLLFMTYDSTGSVKCMYFFKTVLGESCVCKRSRKNAKVNGFYEFLVFIITLTINSRRVLTFYFNDHLFSI